MASSKTTLRKLRSWPLSLDQRRARDRALIAMRVVHRDPHIAQMKARIAPAQVTREVQVSGEDVWDAALDVIVE